MGWVVRGPNVKNKNHRTKSSRANYKKGSHIAGAEAVSRPSSRGGLALGSWPAPPAAPGDAPLPPHLVSTYTIQNTMHPAMTADRMSVSFDRFLRMAERMELTSGMRDPDRMSFFPTPPSSCR